MFDYRYEEVELLSPVGNWDSLAAAVDNGCDAVYLGAKQFNARENADNFTLKELKDVFNYVHIRGVKVYVTINILYKDSEIKEVLQFVEEIYYQGVDAVILQDLGIAKLIHDFFPDLELHASTQLTIHNLTGAKYLEELGFSRVVVARELSLIEIKEIIDKTNLEIESFIHGALCISYSGQCLMSSLIGGRSGNRGRCAQPCRLPYTLVDLDTKEVIDQDLAKKHLLSPKDINTLEIIPQLIQAGITSFKIEGRMKRPEYTALTTKLYRKYINQYLRRPDSYQILDKDKEELKQIFNRGGFIPGYYLGKDNLNLISYQRPKNWGVKVGEVIDYNYQSKECKIRLFKELAEGDGIEIWTNAGRNPGLKVTDYRELSEDIIVVKIKGEISSGDKVYRTSQADLLSRMKDSFKQLENLKKIEIYGQFKAKLGQPMTLSIWDQDGHYANASSHFYPEKAKNSPISQEEIIEQLNKLGNTAYLLSNVELKVDNNLFIPISKLNQIRRDAVAKLDQQRSRQFIKGPRQEKIDFEELSLTESNRKDKEKLSVYLKNSQLALDVLGLEIDRLYLDSHRLDFANLERLTECARKNNTEIYIKLPQIARKEELNRVKSNIERLAASDITGYLVSQLGVAKLLTNTDKRLIADFSLNNFNSYTIKHWEEEEYSAVVLSPELNLSEISHLSQWNNIDQEVVVYGHLPMMVTEYCPIGAVNSNFTKENSCKINCSQQNYGLLDRKGMIAPILTESRTCSSVIYNSQPLYLLNYLAEIKKAGCQSYRLDFILEKKEEIIQIINAYRDKLNNLESQSQKLKELNNKFVQGGYTTGHFYRGVK